MPGLFGAIGVQASVQDALEREVLQRWPNASFERDADALLGAQAFGGAQAIFRLDDHDRLALDGEWSLYREVRPELAESVANARRRRGGYLDPNLNSAGNVALLNSIKKTVHLAVDLTGTFPLYYASLSGGLIFGSLLRPLAHLTGARRDDIAVLEFLRQAYTVGGKTVYQGIQRLLPGQSLTFEVGGLPKIHERSDAWAGPDVSPGPKSVAEDAWERLLASLSRGVPESGSALMMSGGWDSRTLLAGLEELSKRVHCYSHGDVESRELAIARRLSEAAGAECELEPIDDRVLDTDLLSEGFLKTENVVFPHWHRAGKLLANVGVETVSAGVFGEILGGHYGPAMLERPFGKMVSIGSGLLGLKPFAWQRKRRSARDFLRVANLGHHWYLKSEWEAELGAAEQRMNADIESAIARLETRGVVDDVSLVEGFISEHRGTQYINTQLLSCRAHTDIALPFAGREMFSFSTRASLDAKIHNRLNRRILKAHAPHLLRAPMAATLVPASWPLLLQEASRAGRKVYERARMSSYRWTGGGLPRPRLGWVNFEFLAHSSAFEVMANDLKCEFWDRDAIRAQTQRMFESKDRGGFHPVFDQMAKIYTIDLTLRPGNGERHGL